MSAYASNQHCVEKLLVLSESHAVVATQDIFDESGFKLLAKGAEISRAMQDRLLLRRLRAPLESLLAVHDGVTVSELMQGALEEIEQSPTLARIAGGREARALLREARDLHIPPPLCLLLTCARNNDPESFRRARMVVAICAGIASEFAVPAHDAHLALVAAALHDIGEIYVHPDYLHPQRHLTPREWKHVATHPHVGQLPKVPATESLETPQALHAQLDAAGGALQAVRTGPAGHAFATLCDKGLLLLEELAKSLRATGVLDAGILDSEFLDDGLQAEIQQVVSEVTWRMRNLARNLFMRVDAWNDEASLQLIQPAIELLDRPAGVA